VDDISMLNACTINKTPRRQPPQQARYNSSMTAFGQPARRPAVQVHKFNKQTSGERPPVVMAETYASCGMDYYGTTIATAKRIPLAKDMNEMNPCGQSFLFPRFAASDLLLLYSYPFIERKKKND